MEKLKIEKPGQPQWVFFRYAIPGFLFYPFLLLFWILFSFPSMVEAGDGAGEDVPLWWPDTLKRAESAGYTLITLQELKALIQSEETFTLLDVRPDYEYGDGHIPGAVNLEFNLGHRSRVEKSHSESLKALLGEDRGRLVVTYCRNFR